jgi:Mor family transcriptional regulator
MNLGPEYPELLADLALQLREFLITDAGVEPDKADKLARDAVENVRQNWGGQLIYVPTGLGHEVQQRWQEIWDKFTGDNVPRSRKSTVAPRSTFTGSSARCARSRAAPNSPRSFPPSNLRF